MALRLFFERKRREVDSGTTVRATKSEARSEKAMDRPRAWVILPVMPEAKIMGKKTAIVVRVEAVMAMPTSLVPAMEAWSAPSPSSRCR